MSQLRSAGWKHAVCKCLLLWAVPTACAVGTEPDELAGSGGSGGTEAEGGSAGTGVIPSAGTNSTSGTSSTGGTSSNPFGGTSGGAGKAGSGGSGGKAGGGSGGSAAGGSSGGAGGTGGALCACTTTRPWVDNTVINWATGDCFSLGTATYVYTGVRAQTYANSQCNPMMQEAWCTDTSNDYKFMLCP